ncbi:MFS general substrate transporter [Delitschia confertaspora ATCC 74209]|uniref:MFS general substrate transporter n=1 Tax=Delitschia confertaspora ATCC 74209 TaxID=1513339 RepID=A0A9P4JH81_9PLEO|nr:MFS general substrate transporter [Delitschia confertaspora ATCC 74209]
MTNESFSPSPSSVLRPPFNRTAEQKLLRKLDVRILPVLWILHFVNFVDRANIGNAKIQGMENELHLTGQRFNIAVWVFNLGYLVAGVPAAVAFKKYGPKSLVVMMFCWGELLQLEWEKTYSDILPGITVIGCGLVQNYQGLIACRLLEGMTEAFFFTASVVAGAFNGFISSLIANTDGAAGYKAWRWIFIIEGLITIAVSASSYFLIVPFPEDCKFLNPKEKELLLVRVKADGGDVAHDGISPLLVLHHLKDWKIWAAVFMNVGVTENANSISNFQPTILRGLGYTATQAQVHTIPVYLVGCVFSVFFAYLSERFRRRYLFFLFGFTVLAIGLIVEITYPAAPGVRYMGLFFMASGAFLAMPISVVWISINVSKGYKRTIALGAIVNFGTAGAFVSTNVFLKREEPRFHTAFSTGLGLACMGLAAATVFYVGCRVENMRRDKRKGELPTAVESGGNEAVGERHPDFRYSL